MTITEAEIRTALQRAVEQADRTADPAEGAVQALAPRRPRARILVAAAAVVAVLAGLAFFAADDGQQVRTGPTSTGTELPAASDTTVASDTTEATEDPRVTTTERAPTTDPDQVVATTDPGLAGTTTTEVHGSATATTTPLPRNVVVRVLNGSATSGAAGVLSPEVAALGYQVGEVGNAWLPFDESEVFFTEGFEGAARSLADRLGIARTSLLPPASTTGIDQPGADVVVVVGSDLARPG